jgi:hypothetical protein
MLLEAPFALRLALHPHRRISNTEEDELDREKCQPLARAAQVTGRVRARAKSTEVDRLDSAALLKGRFAAGRSLKVALTIGASLQESLANFELDIDSTGIAQIGRKRF